MSDVGIQIGDVPGGPPVNLPAPPGTSRQRITITPDPSRAVPFVPPGNVPISPPQGDPHAFLEDYAPPEEKATGSKAKGDPHAFLEDWKPSEQPEPKPAPEVSGVQAAISGGLNALSFGFAPAIAGLAEAAGPEWQAADIYQNADKPVPNLIAPVVGAAKLLHGYLSGHPDDAVRKAYEKGRQAALESQEGAEEQHPYAYWAGQFAGSLLSPTFIGLRGAGFWERAARGLASGGIGGGLYGAGGATSAGGDLSDVAKGTLANAALGGTLGGAVGGVLGPRVVNPTSPGQRAAATAEALVGEPALPRGLASDNPFVNATTARARSVPLVGTRISGAVDKIQEATGEFLGDTAGTMGATDRATGGALTRYGLQDVVDANKRTIDAGYNGVRSQIDQTKQFTMPRTDAALNGIMADRAEAGWTNPAEGLEQFRNVAGGATFNGAHRARADAAKAGNYGEPHAGYDAGDFRRLREAMKQDVRDIVRHAATGNPRDALAAFDAAEKQFGPLAEHNRLLQGLIEDTNESRMGALLNASNKKTGNLQLLAQLRNSMSPQDFEVIGGTLLNELGQHPTGEFSLRKFLSDWGRVSPGAKRVLFSPEHLANIESIFGMAKHIKGSLKESNTSHTANAYIMFDLAKDFVILSAATAAGHLGGETIAGLGAGAAAVVLTHWLASPAKAASMSAWARSYRAIAGGRPNPAQIAAFNMTTRNLAHNLGVPAQAIVNSVRLRLGRSEMPSSGENEPDNK